MITLDNLTDLAAASFDGVPDPRRRELLQQLVRHLHAYARATRLTHDEWRAAVAFLHRVGDISSDQRSEFTLLSDVLGLSSLIDLLGSPPQGTPGSVLGPFHSDDSPWMDSPADLARANPGERVRVCGRVLDTAGRPLPQASVDFWQNADNGLYWQMDPTQPRDNLRARVRVDAGGAFAITTVRPRPYQIPTDGPVWTDLVGPAGRTAWRPAHFHLIAAAPGQRRLITELFDADDPYLGGDAVFGVRDALVRRYAVEPDSPLPTLRIDLVLTPDH